MSSLGYPVVSEAQSWKVLRKPCTLISALIPSRIRRIACGPSMPLRPGKTCSSTRIADIASITAIAASDTGTRCSLRAFMRLAGTVHTRSAKSISSHRAPKTSPVSPEMRSTGSFDQLRRNAYPLPCFPYRSFEHVPHVEVLPDLLHVDRAALVGEARIARDDKEPADARERRNDLPDHAVGKILLLRIASDIGERQYRNRRLVGQDRWSSRRCCRVPARFYDTDKADVLAWYGADQPLDFTAVADRPAHRADAASQGRFGDDPPTPYRGQQVVLADHPVAVLQEIDQEIEDLRFEGDRLCAPPLLPPVRVEHMIAEGEFHFRSPGGQQSRRIKRGLSSGLRR